MTQFLTILIIFAALCGTVYVLIRPRWAVVVVLVMFPLMQILQTYSDFLHANKPYMNIGIGLLALFALASKIARGEQTFSGYFNGATIMTILLLGWAALSVLWTPSRETAIEYVLGGLPYYALMLVITPLLLTDTWDLRRLWLGMLVVGTVIAFGVILNPQAGYYAGRLVIEVGHYSGQEMLSALATARLGGVLAIIAVLIRFERAGWLLNGIRVVAFLAGLGLAVMAGSRGQVFAAMVVATCLYPVARQITNPKQFMMTAAGFGVVAMGMYAVLRMFIFHENVERWGREGIIQAVSFRFESITLLFGEWVTSPMHWLIGLGANAYGIFHRDPYVHNLLVEVLCEQGLIGAALLGGVFFVTFFAARTLWRVYRDDPCHRAAVSILFAICAYEFLLSLKQGTYLGYASPLFWLVILTKVSRHEARTMAEAYEEQFEAVEEFADESQDEPGGFAIAH